jgi:Ala-tRNA(Pro) deacylase
MNATMTLDRPHEGLLAWLAREGVDHDIHAHEQSFTAWSSARAEGVDPLTFAKVVVVATDDGRRAMLVLDATDHVDLHRAREVLGAHDVRLLTEAELADLSPDCELGALPAVGSLCDLPTYADFAVRDDPAISFNAGSHRFSVRVDRRAWEHAAGVIYADLAREADRRPAWAS